MSADARYRVPETMKARKRDLIDAISDGWRRRLNPAEAAMEQSWRASQPDRECR
jgi:hypothetical protein